ncbi:MAG: aminotransferase class I/II-fold pyridoxal phosphate-dependent enzyme [Mycobacteriales bacterium]
MDHSRAPVLEALVEYRRRGDVPFTPPGHKQGRGADPRVLEILGEQVFAADVLAMSGLDDRRMSSGVLEKAQRLMADAVGADHAFFSTCGSSLSVKSAMLAVAGPGEKLLINRNSHKSVIAAVIINGVRPIWVRPAWDAHAHLAHPPRPEAVEEAFAAEPDAKGMLLISPVDYGTCADIAAIRRVCHDRDVPLIVDEAWGAHLPFHPDLPAWAMDEGADLCVTSVHKMGGGLEQSSVFHLQGDRVDPAVLKAREDLLGTTSPSTLVYAALDGWRRQMIEHGRDLLDRALEHAAAVRADLRTVDGLRLLGHDELVGPGLAHDLDPLKILMDVSGLGISGYQAADWLREHRHVNMDVSDHARVCAQITHADDEKTVEALCAALRALADAAGDLPPGPPIRLPEPAELELETVIPPRDAFFGRTEDVPAGEAVGRIAAEMASPYPPGVPVLTPGERITAPVVEYLRTGIDAGMHVPDTADPTCRSLKVVVE